MARTRSNTAAVEASWYDYPQYYDLAFRSETAKEANFVEAAAGKYCDTPLRSIFEPACGSGRLITELAARGYRVTGLDLNRPPLDYCRRRLDRRQLDATLIQADMADFRLDAPVEVAICPVNSFRHLLTEAAAKRHLECVAEHLRPGGIYILGLHLLPPDADERCVERWTERHGQLEVTVTLRVLEASRRQRIERLRISVLVRKPSGEFRFRDEFPLRTYSAAQLRSLLKSVPSLRLRDVYDFWYEIGQPLRLNNELADTVLVLQRV